MRNKDMRKKKTGEEQEEKKKIHGEKEGGQRCLTRRYSSRWAVLLCTPVSSSR
jgi:hypothetical protein